MNASNTFRKQLSLLITLIICAVLFAGCNASPTTPLSPDGREPLTHQIEIAMLGAKTEALVDSQGKLSAYFESSSNDGEISLSINGDTTLLDKKGEPLSFIEATIDSNPLPPPENAQIVGAIYDLRPQGATFNPPLKFTLSYDPADLPLNAKESDVYIASYIEGAGWGKSYYKMLDTETHRVTTYINQSAKFAVLVPVKANSPEPPGNGVVEIVYFHRPQRCSGCVYAETGTQYTLENYFAGELVSGRIVFKVINLGDKANTAIVEHYGAYTSSLFINSIRGDTKHIEEVKEIWFLLGKDSEFVTLVKSKIDRYLSGEIP